MIKHTKAEWYGNECNLPDGSYISNGGDVCYIKNGKWHREDGPAIEWASGNKFWRVGCVRHREDGPAIEYCNGERRWYVNDKLCSKESHEEELKIWKMNEAMK